MRGLLDEGLPESVVRLEAQFETLKAELLAALRPEPAQQMELPLFGELVAAWLEHIRPHRVGPGNEERLARHLRSLFLDDESSLSVGAVETLLKTLELSPSTRNKVRGVGRLTVARAQAERRWRGPNPFELVRRQREPRRKYETLSLDELVLLQRKLREDRRRQFRVSLHLGLRTGELFALRKEDVDFRMGSVLIHRSHERDSTKTGRERLVPLLPAIAQDLYEACRLSSSELVFPGEDGKLQRHDSKLTRVIRTAMVAARVGIIDVTYKCRRCGQANTLPPPVSENVCTTCDVLRWPVPRVRPFRWYDLRHACATMHHRAGADPLAVSLLLGHSVKGTTQAVYTHPEITDLHRELTKWALPR